MTHKDTSKEVIKLLLSSVENKTDDNTSFTVDWHLLRVLLHTFLAAGDAAKQAREQPQQIEVGDFITFRNGDELQTGRVDRVVYRVKINDALVIMVGASEITYHEKGQP